MINKIHKTAVIGNNVVLGKDNEVGPYTVIDGNVNIGDNNKFISHVVISGTTKIGNNNKFFPFAAVGLETQDLKYDGGSHELRIGNFNTIREYVTINPGSEEGSKTIVGNNNHIMISSHIAHDCIIGNNVRLTNNATLGGHVIIGDYAIIGGLVGVHQRTKIGDHAMIGGGAIVVDDVIPYGMVVGDRAYLAGLNIKGLKRRGFKKDDIRELKQAFDIVFSEENMDESFEQKVERAKHKFEDSEFVSNMINFILSESERILCKPKF